MTTATTDMKYVAAYLDAKRRHDMAEAVREFVNAHDKLVAACRAIHDWYYSLDTTAVPEMDVLDTAIGLCNEALADAESSENSAGSPAEQRSTH